MLKFHPADVGGQIKVMSEEVERHLQDKGIPKTMGNIILAAFMVVTAVVSIRGAAATQNYTYWAYVPFPFLFDLFHGWIPQWKFTLMTVHSCQSLMMTDFRLKQTKKECLLMCPLDINFHHCV